MSTVKILHTGDFHLESARTGAAHGKSELLNTFLRVLNLCKTQEIDFLLIAGDLFDNPFPSSDTVDEIAGAMSQLTNTAICISPGNHDCACPGSVWLTHKFPPNVYIFNGFGEFIDFPQKNTRIYGGAFTDRFEKLSLMSTFQHPSTDTINICVLHGDLVSGQSETPYNPITAQAISSSGFDYLALGHIHKRSEISKLGNTYYSYCGCPDGRGFDEDGSRGVYIGTIAKGKCDLNYTETSSRKYILNTVNITSGITSMEIADKILESIKTDDPNYAQNLYRIALKGTLDCDFSPNLPQIEAILKEHISGIQISDNTDTDFTDIEKITKESSLRGIFTSKLLEMSNSESADDAELYRQALKLGLRAFEKEVSLNDN